MPNFAAIQAKIDYGAGRAGAVLGTPYTWYRPSGSAAPTRDACTMGTLPVYVTTDAAGKSRAAPQPGKPLVYGTFDRTATLPGDYLVGPDGAALFIASQPAMLATLLVQCNRVVGVGRPDKPGGPGPLPEGLITTYVADTSTSEDVILTGWPCAVTIKTRGETGRVDLPGDVKLAVWELLLPVTAPAIRTSDVVTDDQGQRYIIGAAEQTDTGWRLLGQLENA